MYRFVTISLLFIIVTVHSQEQHQSSRTTTHHPDIAITVLPKSEPEPEPFVISTDLKSPSSPPIAEPPPIIDDALNNEASSSAPPPPQQPDADLVQALIDGFLGGKSNTNTNASVPQLPIAITRLVNSSVYWSADAIVVGDQSSKGDVDAARKWISGYVHEAEMLLPLVIDADWNYVTNVTDVNQRLLFDTEKILDAFLKSTSRQARQFDAPLIGASNSSLQRMLELIAIEGINALPSELFDQLNYARKRIYIAFDNGTICDRDRPPPCTLRIRDVQSMLAHERDASRLLHIWLAWRDAVGIQLNDTYEQLVKISNQGDWKLIIGKLTCYLGANLNGFKDAGAMWRSPYEMSTRDNQPELNLIAELDRLFDQMRPFYTQLHAYMRRQLAAIYSSDVPELTSDGPIPAHLLGSTHAEHWSHLYYETRPYADEDHFVDPIDTALNDQNCTVTKMYEHAENYFLRLGFDKLPESFWQKSVFTRQWNQDMICDPPSAVDFRNGRDYRIKVCAQVSSEDFVQAHRLLAQTYYQIAYRQQPLPFQEAANPSFLSAFASLFGRLSQNRQYLHSLKLIKPDMLKESESKQVNRLYREALEKFVALPFDLVADNWRWKVFAGQVNSKNWNEEWWMLRKHYQGLMSPTNQRPSTHYFDAISTPIIAQQNYPAVRTFIGYVLQFQMMKALCPSNTSLTDACMLDAQSGSRIRDAMQLGASKKWIHALKMLTNTTQLDARPMLDYFAPLMRYLQTENNRTKVYIGWNGSGTPFKQSDIPERLFVESNNDFDSLPSADRVAYPGDDCSDGRDCLLDSTCNGTVCECIEGTFTFVAGNTYNCLPGDPADVGFGDSGGLLIGLFPNTGSTPSSEPEPESEPKVTLKSASLRINSMSLIHLLFVTLWLMVVVR